VSAFASYDTLLSSAAAVFSDVPQLLRRWKCIRIIGKVCWSYNNLPLVSFAFLAIATSLEQNSTSSKTLNWILTWDLKLTLFISKKTVPSVPPKLLSWSPCNQGFCIRAIPTFPRASSWHSNAEASLLWCKLIWMNFMVKFFFPFYLLHYSWGGSITIPSSFWHLQPWVKSLLQHPHPWLQILWTWQSPIHSAAPIGPGFYKGVSVTVPPFSTLTVRDPELAQTGLPHHLSSSGLLRT
jgi:hypothetical protein